MLRTTKKKQLSSVIPDKKELDPRLRMSGTSVEDDRKETVKSLNACPERSRRE